MPDPISPTSPRSPTNASFPSPLQAGRSNTPSIISSRMTDVASEDGDDFWREGPSSSLRPGTSTSNHAYRPGSALSSHARPPTTGPSSRRGIGSPASSNTLRMGGGLGIGSSAASISRPGSSTSKISRTHVPQIASQAFFRPMSSQRLQAQRSARPSRGKTSVNTEVGNNTASSTRRNSLTSNPTEFPTTVLRTEPDVPPPTRGTNFSDADDRTTINASPDGKYTFQSYGGSERPLQQSMDDAMDGRRQGNPLGSEDSPSLIKAHNLSSSTPGLNYQYFSGNTFFFLKGRLQNARDRPINIASGLFVVVPAILFLIFS